MRAILVDWMMEVCKEFTLKRETFYLSIHNLDRYLTKKEVLKNELQLVGIANLYIACKIEVKVPPSYKFIFKIGNLPTKSQ